MDGWERITNTPIMTSWGCPFDCTFCSVTAMFGKKYRFRSAESVVAEIKEKNPEKIFFYDDNMAANRKRLKRLLQLMIDEGVAVPWGAQVRTDVVRDQELMELMRASNCDFVALGLESVNQATLDSFEKSQTVGDIEHAIKVLHDYGIRAHGMFVLGADHDTPDSVSDTVKFAKKNKIDTVMLNILTPLPGTQQFEELDAEGRILERDWSFYDAQHVVFRPKQMTPYHLLQETIKANKRFYATWRPVWAFHKWLWQRDAVRKKRTWDRMLEYGWLWYYSRTWWTAAKNRAQRRRLKELSKQQPRPAARVGPGRLRAREAAGLSRGACLRRARGTVVVHGAPPGAARATTDDWTDTWPPPPSPPAASGASSSASPRCRASPAPRSATPAARPRPPPTSRSARTPPATPRRYASSTTRTRSATRSSSPPSSACTTRRSWNRQGPDVGDQYRSAVFFHTPEQEKSAQAAVQQLTESGVFKRPIVTQIVAAPEWWRAEEYHQKYFEKHASFSCRVG